MGNLCSKTGKKNKVNRVNSDQSPEIKNQQPLIEEEKTKSAGVKINKCKTHENESKEFVCFRCKLLICGMCAQSSHKYHKTVSINTELMEKYEFLSYLGKGSYGCVFEVSSLESQPKRYAVKFIDEMTNEILESALNEVKFMSMLDNKYIIKYFSHEYLPNEERLAIFMELAEATLQDVMMKEISLEMMYQYLLHISYGIQYLQSKNIIHRDLKPGNVLIKDGIAKLSDFGLTKQAEGSMVTQTSIFGTLSYLPPEVLKGEKYNKSCDIWALGVIAYQLLHKGKKLFTGKTDEETKDKILNFKLELDPKIENEKGGIIIKNCLQIDMQKRWSLQQIIDLIQNNDNVSNKPELETIVVPFKKNDLSIIREYVVEINKRLRIDSYFTSFRGYHSKDASQLYEIIQYFHSPNEKKRIETELEVTKKVHHPYIQNFIEVITTETHTYIIKELCDGDLEGIWSSVSVEEALMCIKQVSEAMKYLNGLMIMHRDIKPQNIQIKSGKIKISDFCLSRFFLSQNDSEDYTSTGSPYYMTPEMISRQKYGPKCDVWSLGIVFFQLLFKKLPWTKNISLMHLMFSIQKGVEIPVEPVFDERIIDLLRKMLKVQPEDRIDFDGILAHEAIQRDLPERFK